MYLDDYTPIRTIEVSKIGQNVGLLCGYTMFGSGFIWKLSFFKVTSEYLRGCFEIGAGEITDVSIDGKLVDNEHIRVAYVTFEKPEDAAKWVGRS